MRIAWPKLKAAPEHIWTNKVCAASPEPRRDRLMAAEAEARAGGQAAARQITETWVGGASAMRGEVEDYSATTPGSRGSSSSQLVYVQ
eukprot:4566657-Pyramimonas_sp.AAC.3